MPVVPDAAGGKVGEVAAHRSRSERVFLLLLVVLTALVVAGHFRPYLARDFFPGDLGAYYCAGKVVLHHQDPYRVEPLLDCERSIPMERVNGDTVDPAPLPGYDYIPMAALAILPPHFAAVTFGILLLGATVLIAYCLTRMSALPPIVAFAVAFMGITYDASGTGQLPPLAIAAAAAGALLLRLGKHRWAVLAASGTLLQPQFGLPILVALFLFIPRARLVTAMIGAALVLFSIAAVGVRGTIEYLSVVPIHARSEVTAPIQYSFTWLAHVFGASANVALMIGTVSYIVFFAICLLVLARGGERAVKTGAIILLPAAFAIFGGTFIHYHQVTVALLAAVVLIVPTRSGTPLMLLPAALLTVPFVQTQYSTTAALPSLLLAVIAAWCVVFFPTRTSGERTAAKNAFVTATAVAGFIALMLVLFHPLHEIRLANGHFDIMRAARLVHDPDALATLESEQEDDAMAKYHLDPTPLFYYILLKLPTWCGVAMTLWFSSRVLLGEREDRRQGLEDSAPVAEVAPWLKSL